MPGISLDDVLSDTCGLALSDDLGAAVTGWLDHLRHTRGHSDATLEAYARDLRQFLSWLRQHLGHAPCLGDLGQLRAKGFRAFMASRRKAGLESRSLARTMSALRQFFRWLEAEETLKNRSVLSLALPKVPHGIPKPLTVEKAAAVVGDGMEAVFDWIAARDLAVLLLLYGSGLRIAEALSLKVKDAPLGDNDVLRIMGKGAKERLVPVLPITQEAIARYLRLCPYPSEPGRSAVPRRQRRAAIAAHHPASHGAVAHRPRSARDGNAACAAALIRHASVGQGGGFAPDPGAAGSCQPVHDPGLHRGRSRAPAQGV